MDKSTKDYLKQHIWNILQCFFGFCCLVLATLEYRRSGYGTGPASPSPTAGVAMTQHYSMPWYLWAGIVALALSVIIPALIRMARQKRVGRNPDDPKIPEALAAGKIDGGEAALFWHYAAVSKNLARWLETIWHHWHNAGDVLEHPLGQNTKVKTWLADHTNELHAFKILYKDHLTYLNWEIPEFSCNAILPDIGSKREYLDLLDDLRTHASALDRAAQSICVSTEPLGYEPGPKRQELPDPVDIPRLDPPSIRSTDIFTPLQIEAFQLAKDIRTFLRDMGEMPKTKMPEHIPSADYEKYVREQLNLSGPWMSKLTATYESDFAPRVKRLYLEFKKRGITQGGIKSVSEGILDDRDVAKIPGWIVALAHQVDGL